jgi:hypothetical protein
MAGVLSMNRIRLAALSAALLAGVVAGCTNFGQGPIMSRFRGRSECPCEDGAGPCCDGPLLGDGMAGGPPLPPPPGAAVVPGVTPVPPPRILVDPAQPVPAVPSSRTK